MSKLKIKEIIVCVISLIVLAIVIMSSLTTKSFASDINSLMGGTNNTANTIEEDPNSIEEPSNTTGNSTKNTTNNVVNNTANKNTNNNTNNNTAIPYTGVDNSIIFIIAVCGISAVYAYKKIRDYKNI